MKMYFLVEYKSNVGYFLAGWVFFFNFCRVQTKLKHGVFEKCSNILLGVDRKKYAIKSPLT